MAAVSAQSRRAATDARLRCVDAASQCRWERDELERDPDQILIWLYTRTVQLLAPDLPRRAGRAAMKFFFPDSQDQVDPYSTSSPKNTIRGSEHKRRKERYGSDILSVLHERAETA